MIIIKFEEKSYLLEADISYEIGLGVLDDLSRYLKAEDYIKVPKAYLDKLHKEPDATNQSVVWAEEYNLGRPSVAISGEGIERMFYGVKKTSKFGLKMRLFSLLIKLGFDTEPLLKEIMRRHKRDYEASERVIHGLDMVRIRRKRELEKKQDKKQEKDGENNGQNNAEK